MSVNIDRTKDKKREIFESNAPHGEAVPGDQVR